MKKAAAILTACVLLCVYVLNSYAYNTLQVFYWHSNSNNVGHWASTPTISSINYSTSANFYYLAAYPHATAQWSSAGISTSPDGWSWSSNIICRGGTITQLVNNVPNLTYDQLIGKSGLTLYTSNMDAYLDYYGVQKYRYQMTAATVLIIDCGETLNEEKKTFTHELGHALGWIGHSNVSSDIMYYATSSVTSLTTNDKEHLVQIY